MKTDTSKPHVTLVDCQNAPASQLTTIEMMVNSLQSMNDLTKVKVLRSVQVREMSSSTYLGNGLAIPHARMDDINQLEIAVGYFPAGIKWPDEDSIAHLVVLLAVPHDMVQAYLVFMKKFVAFYKTLDAKVREERWSNSDRLHQDMFNLLEV